MPSVLAEYFDSKNLLRCQEIQSAILLAYQNDFGKYALRTPYTLLQTVFIKAPGLIGQWLKYNKIDADAASSTVKTALYKLKSAGLIIPVYATSAAGLPFISHINEKKYKFIFLDVGLVKRACNLDLEVLLKEDFLLLNRGALAEQFVGQSILSIQDPLEGNGLFAWAREEKNSSAEIDYLISVGQHIVPIEVKAGGIGTLRSLKIFLTEKRISYGVRISEHPLELTQNILSLPFYLIEELPRLVRELYDSTL